MPTGSDLPLDQPANARGQHDRPGALQLTGLPPLSLYIHIPWCIRKCPYCDFNSHQRGQGSWAQTQARYLAALRVDLDASVPLVWGRGVHSVFIGGGTPSLFHPDAIAQLLSDVRARLRLAPDAEVTLEANPGTYELERFKGFRQAGVTRLSVGVQSFNEQHLQALGRVHGRAQALAAIEEAAIYFDSYNLDLMYALPGQSLADLRADVATALALRPPHLSIYHLTIEPNTYFAKYPPPRLPSDDLAYDMLDRITEQTQAMGLQRYEVSAFAQSGHRCWHNLNYWQFGDYLGIGAGAHGKISFAHRIVRQVRWRDPARYMQAALDGQPVAQEHAVPRRDLVAEYMLGALRVRDGFALADFTDRTGLPLSAIEAPLAEGERRGWLERSLGWVKPSAQGMNFLSDLQMLFLPEESAPDGE